MFTNKKIDKIYESIENIEKSNLRELSYIIGSKKEVFFRNFFAGLARGVGIGIGVTVITAMLILMMQRIVKLNIPIIGEYVADIMEIVEQQKY